MPRAVPVVAALAVGLVSACSGGDTEQAVRTTTSEGQASNLLRALVAAS